MRYLCLYNIYNVGSRAILLQREEIALYVYFWKIEELKISFLKKQWRKRWEIMNMQILENNSKKPKNNNGI